MSKPSSRTDLTVLFSTSGRLARRAAAPLAWLSALFGIAVLLLLGALGFAEARYCPIVLRHAAGGNVGTFLFLNALAFVAFALLTGWLGATLTLLVADVWWRGRARPLRDYLFRAVEYVPELCALFVRHSPWFLAGLWITPAAAIGLVATVFIGLATILQNAEPRLAGERGREVIWKHPETVASWTLIVLAVFYLAGRFLPNVLAGLVVMSPALAFLGIFPILLFLEHGLQQAQETAAPERPRDFRLRKSA